MHEELIKRAIKLKINTAEKILELLPTETSNSIRDFGILIYESIGECIRKTANEAGPEVNPTKGVNNVIIE